MAEKIVSPGVFTNEIDQSFLPAAIGEIGAAIVGPTVKGPALVPTVVSSYSEYQQIFGDSFKSGSSYVTYLTSLTAQQYLKNAGRLTVVRILDGSFSGATGLVPTGSGNWYTGSGGDYSGDAIGSFKLNTLADGAIMNSTIGVNGYEATDLGTNNVLTNSGSKHNLRWEVSSINQSKGTFTLLIRQGNDSNKRKQILETFNNISLDPNSNNYISKMIGDSYNTIAGTESDPYLTFSGEYPPKSKYVYVSNVKDTIDYLDENGNITLNSASASLPGIGSGSFVGGTNGWAGFDGLGNFSHAGGNAAANYNFNENIGASSQGFVPATDAKGKTAYNKALNLLSNQDEYDINMILLPGLEQTDHNAVIDKAITVCEDRGDCFVIADPVAHGKTITNATDEAKDYDSNYAAMYWPWVQIPDNQLGKNVWVPPSVVMGGIYSFNDTVAHPWFAPAGLNRGGIDVAIQAERKLTHSNRDTLYDAHINPIATFPGQGVTVWGQKTLQKKASALDRVNVRRLLIKVKKFIASSSRFLVFEQNNASTRRRFLNIVNPFLEQVQSNSGLTAFRVVMDESNNTPDVVDRNILYGQIFVQPTRTAEFIVLDFTVQPTGATFPE